MTHKYNKLKRYQLTYPVEGSTIHLSKSSKKAIKKCYKDYTDLDTFENGMFGVTNLDTGVEYHFQLSKNKLHKLHKINNESYLHYGGDLNQNNNDNDNDNDTKLEVIQQILTNPSRPAPTPAPAPAPAPAPKPEPAPRPTPTPAPIRESPIKCNGYYETHNITDKRSDKRSDTNIVKKENRCDSSSLYINDEFIKKWQMDNEHPQWCIFI
jgi:hypothetical protein